MSLQRLAPATVLATVLAVMPGIPSVSAQSQAQSQAGGADQIARAQALLTDASAALSAASGDETRLSALGRAATAHQAALSALRAGLRKMAATERAMTGEIDAEARTLDRLLTALQSLSRAPASALLAVRGGPIEATRAAKLASELDRRGHRAGPAVPGAASPARPSAGGTGSGPQCPRRPPEPAHRNSNAPGRRDRSGLVARPELRRQAEAAATRARGLDGLATALRVAGMKAGTGFSAAPLPVAGQISAGFGAPDPWGRPGHGWSIEAPAFAQVGHRPLGRHRSLCGAADRLWPGGGSGARSGVSSGSCRARACRPKRQRDGPGQGKVR